MLRYKWLDIFLMLMFKLVDRVTLIPFIGSGVNGSEVRTNEVIKRNDIQKIILQTE